MSELAALFTVARLRGGRSKSELKNEAAETGCEAPWSKGARTSDWAVRSEDTETQDEVSDQKEDSLPSEPAYSKERGALSRAVGDAPVAGSAAAHTREKR